MNRFPRFCIALLLLILSTALSQDIRYNFDKTADFSKFRTYRWVIPPFQETIDFYRHAHRWSNRLIAGDSLLVMNSLIEKEGMAGSF